MKASKVINIIIFRLQYHRHENDRVGQNYDKNLQKQQNIIKPPQNLQNHEKLEKS